MKIKLETDRYTYALNNIFVPETILEIYGMNNSGKTYLLNVIKQYCNRKKMNYMFFPDIRYMNVSKDDIEAIEMAHVLSGNQPYREMIEEALDMKDPITFEQLKKGEPITSGYMQVMNFVYTILLDDRKNKTILIDNFCQSLHVLIREQLIQFLLTLPGVESIIFTAFDRSDLNIWGIDSDNIYMSNIYDIRTEEIW